MGEGGSRSVSTEPRGAQAAAMNRASTATTHDVREAW